MVRKSLLLLLLLGSACREGATETGEMWKTSYSPAECAALMSEKSIVTRCGKGDIVRAMTVLSDDITQCLPFSRPLELQGVWVEGFELSAFYEGARTYADVSTPDGRFIEPFMWLSMTKEASQQLPPQDREFAAHQVEVLGKRSLCGGRYGHLGNGSSEVVVTDFLKVASLPNASD